MGNGESSDYHRMLRLSFALGCTLTSVSLRHGLDLSRLMEKALRDPEFVAKQMNTTSLRRGDVWRVYPVKESELRQILSDLIGEIVVKDLRSLSIDGLIRGLQAKPSCVFCGAESTQTKTISGRTFHICGKKECIDMINNLKK